MCQAEIETDMKYDVFVIDPPWQKRKGGIRESRPNQRRELDYPTMSVGDIFELLDTQIFSMASDNHCVFMWTIEDFLHAADQEMTMRGYRRHCRFIWDKTDGVCPAFTIRYSHEYLVWYYKPKLLPINRKVRGNYRTVFTEKAREHSRKPDFSYAMISELYPLANKIDVFSREKRDGWAQFGNEIDLFSSK